MSNITVSYQEYDRLCDLMPKLTLLPARIPNNDEAELLVSSPHFLSMAVWLSLIHISEPTRQAEISYAVFCLKKKKKKSKA